MVCLYRKLSLHSVWRIQWRQSKQSFFALTLQDRYRPGNYPAAGISLEEASNLDIPMIFPVSLPGLHQDMVNIPLPIAPRLGLG
ncbi:hypothetical protein C7271_07415 [filamentous cyanobacterium CCP5]|nr:hypothetical protein C7271_07415 [filamentous cyanobacterium CCP5]